MPEIIRKVDSGGDDSWVEPGLHRRFGAERGIGIFDQGSETRWRGATDGIGIGIWEDAFAGAEDNEVGRKI